MKFSSTMLKTGAKTHLAPAQDEMKFGALGLFPLDGNLRAYGVQGLMEAILMQ